MKNNINITKTITLFFCIAFISMQFSSCKKVEMKIFTDKSAIYFPTETGWLGADKKGIDSVHVSFFHNPGKEELTIPFRIALIGGLLAKDTEYELEIIDSLTTAKPDEYALPERLLFKKGVNMDSLFIKIFKKDRLSESDARVVFKIVENENFRQGYFNKLTVKLRFDNIISKPTWWDNIIEFVYLGAFSAKKYEVFIIVSGLNTIEGIEPWELRQICLDMRKYIEKEGITEVDGSPMEIAAY